MHKLPFFYFRPTICWIDDDSTFLEAINIAFQDKYNCLTFSKPEAALQFFESYQSPLSNINIYHDLIESEKFGTSNHMPIDFNISEIAQIAQLPNKSDEIAVLVIDQNMPGITGLEICKKLKNFPFKKILLTGDTAHEKVIEAFNQGLIDKFISKGSGVADKLKHYIEELSFEFFYEKISNFASNEELSLPIPLTDSLFIDFFNNWRHLNHINEFFLINKQGCFLAKDRNGNFKYLIVMSDTDRNEFLNLYDDAQDKVGPLLSQMAEGKILPFFGLHKEPWEVDFDKWDENFYPSKTLEGRENYGWSIVSL